MKIIINIKNADIDNIFLEESTVEVDIDENFICCHLFDFAKKNNIIPNLNNENLVWIVRVNGFQIFNYFSKSNRYFYCNFKRYKIKKVCKLMKTNIFEFEYFSSPLERGKSLFLAYGGNWAHIGKDGWMEVYGHCNVTKELENEWLNKYKSVI